MPASLTSAESAISSAPREAATDLPRCVLLAGSARGGTSWALKVLDSHPSVCGCHEPFYQLNKNDSLRSLFDRLKAGQGTDEDTRRLISSAINGCVETHKPPFFRKEFLKSPAWLRTGAWMSAKALKPLKPVFQYMATGNLNRSHCLVIKNRPFPMLDRILESIHADAILLLRHPCGVVSSWLRGMRMGVMQANSADPVAVWARYSACLEPLGFTAQRLSSMSDAGVLAVNWLVDTLLFRQYENSRMRTRTIVYEDLVRNPVGEWRQIFEWMEMTFDPAVESFLTRSSKPAFDVRSLLGKRYSYFSVQRSEKSPVEAWRTDMTQKEIDEVMDIVIPHFPIEQYWPEVMSSYANRFSATVPFGDVLTS